MYKEVEVEVEDEDDINLVKNIRCMDSMDTSHYNNLCEICKLFSAKNYKSVIGSKTDADAINQTIMFINRINETDKYTLYIDNKYSITITIPLKNTNNTYSTSFVELGEVYNYLKMHV